jgi:(p)ppGpp synthase/HD superfamily hydrolase
MNMSSLWSQDKYIDAYFYAAEALNGEYFPGTNLPYMVHVSLVSMEVLATLQTEPGIKGDLALQCALLHDVMEDGDKTFIDISEIFGNEVAQGVEALTKNRNLPKSQQMNDSLDRIQKLDHAIWIVKMADRITNLLPPPGGWTSNKIAEYWQEAAEIYECLKPASHFLAERLSAKIKDYEKYIHQE